MSTLSLESPAKVNLTLCVAARRADGYHELESLVARINLCDTISVSLRDDEHWTLACDDPAIPGDERNLVWRAAERLSAHCGVRCGIHLAVKKRIPVGAGLGGGSSNAAATLRLLNRLWHLELADDVLARIGAEVGSDVPLFFHSSPCIIRGRGEIVENVAARLAGGVVLFLPEVYSQTSAVYAAWDRLSAGGGGEAARQPTRPARPPALLALAEVLRRLDDPDRLAPLLFNDLEAAALGTYPALADVAAHLRRALPWAVHMTGSGAAFFCLLADPAGGLPRAQAAAATAPLPVRAVAASFTRGAEDRARRQSF